MNDIRKKYIINIAGDYFNINDSLENKENISGESKLEQFLDSENCLTLCATIHQEGINTQLEFHSEVSQFVNRMVIFFKNKQCRVNENNVHETVQLVVLQGSPTASLYHTLHNVFTPLLLQESKKNNALNQNLQRQLTTFQTNLRSAAFAADSDNTNLNEHNSLSVISTLEHELDYWNSQIPTIKNSDQRDSAMAFRDILKILARDFSMLDALPLIEVEDALEGAHNALDDMWKYVPPYPRNRMQHLMDLIASDVIQCITHKLSNLKIWEDDYTVVSDLLEQSINTGKKWTTACTHLTQLFWPNYALHPWTGEAYIPQSLADLITRLEEVLNIRAIHRQLTRLLNQHEIEDLRAFEMFKPFTGVDILYCGPYSENSWKTAVKQFEYLLLPAEQRVGEKLKIQFNSVSNNTRQLLYEFNKYSQLVERPEVSRILLAERQNLLTSLGHYVTQLSTMITPDQVVSKTDTPRIITEITHIRQIESKAILIKQTAEKFLKDLPGYEELQAQVNELCKDSQYQHMDLFETWARNLAHLIADTSNLSLKESEPVVQFSSAQLMRVNYSPRLVSLIQEHRQLCVLGYRIPPNITQTVTHAKQFMKYARALEQVANFHNTIGDRMISSQRPMMLAGALELSRLVQQEEVVSWGDVRSVEKYVDSLRSAVNRLSRENNLLASHHMKMLEKIAELSDTDLIRHLQKWKDTAKYLRDVMHQIEQQGFTNMQTWKLDIDRTLSQEFEKQYRQSLETIHLHLPEIYSDLVYRDSRLQFNPPEEKLREKYQYQLKRFLDLPKSFRGVSEITEGSVFTEIIERCKDLYAQTEKHTEELFERLRGVIEHWQSWLSLGVLDTTQLHTWQHWDLNFRASKTFGQEVAKLPSTEERVGCIVISLSCLRSDLESHNRSYWSQLMSSLQDSIAQDVVRLQQYVNTSTANLTKQPLTMEQIGQAHASHSDIIKQMPEMKALFEEMDNKNKTLATWTRERVESVARLQAAWERLQSLAENHQHLISKQVDAFKSTINRTCENLNNEIERFSLHWDQFKPRPGSGQISTDSFKNLETYLTTIKEKRVQWNELIKQKEKILQDCEQFGMDPPEFPLCDQVQHDLSQEEDIWHLFEEFKTDLENLTKVEWIVFRKRSFKLEEFVQNWQKRLEESPSTALSTRLLQELQKYEGILPLLKYLRGEDFTDKHWMEVFQLLGIIPKAVDILTLNDFLEVSDRITESGPELQSICKRAASEIVVRQALSELEQWEVQTRFILTEHQDSQRASIMLIKDFKDILNKIGDNQSLLQSVKNSADYESFSERAELWETRLADLDHYLCALSLIQRKWVYLEPIFGSGTLRQERSRFDRLDRDFRHLLNSIHRDTRVTSLARYANIRVVLDTLQEQLSRCQNSLDNFLADKRLKFPRFLFLGDDDLLEILGQSSREQVIQAHLKKLFSGIHNVQISNDAKYIQAMCSLQGEVVPLATPVNIECSVEEWLNDLVVQMQNTLQKLLKQCLIDSQQGNVGPDPLVYPSQILCLSDSITFTLKCEQGIKSATLPPLLAMYKNQLKHYSSFSMSSEEISEPSSESKDDGILELKLKALMLDTIHHIDVIEELIDNNVTSLSDWHWQKQLRFYHSQNDLVNVCMANAQMNYSFEYLGNASKLVRTPLTDKCFLTLTQGIHLGMGGNPYGPAGTGKTESVKALGSLLGRQVLVFNCDEGVDATSMGRILSGLVRSGAWGCFDEFNRLDEATLSAVSMHIQPIQVALRTRKKALILLDQEMDINPHCGIFVTLNPVGGGYKGRNRLPDNLKQLFRPVVMSQPDHEQIARTLLQCDGYQNADLLGRKLVEVFSMANELLSKQQHYDWGLRALKTVLGGCGTTLNRIRKSSDGNNEVDVLKQEMQLVVEALRVNTLSKLTYSDSERFDSLVNDVFIGVVFKNTGHEKLVAALEESCSELGFQVNDRQISKCVELYEQLQQRMGVTIVGPSGSGKSTLRKLLLRALNKMSHSVTQHVFNPKAMTRSQLLGHIDLDTRQWTDGVLTLYALQVYAEPSEVWSWVVCDGDIDPEWVESLNSVLDDNRLLTLPSGWRIQFGPNVNFLFETHDLSYASPATISRMGIVFLSEEDVKLTDIVNNWLSWQPEESARITSHLLNDYFFKAIDWIKAEGDLVIPCSNVSIVQTGLSQLRNVSTKTHFAVALLTGLGGLLVEPSREMFAQKVFEWTGEHCPDENLILKCSYNSNRDTIDIYYSDPNYQIEDSNLIDLPLVLTGQVQQTLDTLKPWLSVGKEEHFILVGPHGSAKSLIINHLVHEQHNMDIATIYCSNNIMPQYVLHKLTQHCMIVSSNRGRVYRPKKGRLVLYFKGLHLLKPDKWGTNILIAFLHQLITYAGLFDANLEWVGLENVTIVGSLSITEKISTRFTSVMKIHTINLPEKEDLTIIYESYLTALLKTSLPNNSVWTAKTKLSKLILTLIAIFDEASLYIWPDSIKNTFTHIQYRHYTFSPHDLTAWCTNLIRYKSILSSNPSDSENSMLEILCYEASRIFRDKLVNDDDHKKFDTILSKVFQIQWGKTTLLNNLNGIYFVPSEQYSSKESVSLTRLNSEDWTNLIKKGIMLYGREGHSLNVQIITELKSLTSTISRSLSQTGGCILLAGRSGVGRHSSIRIVSALQSARLITPVAGTNLQFKNDLKMAMQVAGVEGEQVYFLLEDHMIRKISVLDLVNTFLAAGEIPGLHTTAELDSLGAGLKDEIDRDNYDGNAVQYFMQRVRNNLHMVICLEIDSAEFWRILENCPILYQRCTVIWQAEWCPESMGSVPNLLLQKLVDNAEEEVLIDKMPPGFYQIHQLVKNALATPRRYVSFINLYINLYSEKKRVILERQTKLQAGITKLTEAEGVVADLKAKAMEQQVILAEKQSKANSALDMISATMQNANIHKQEMEILKEQAEKENEQLIKRKKSIEVELAEVEPILQEARSAVGNIKPEALSEIRSLRAPPDVIRDILEGVLRLMGTQDTSWNSMKTFLAKRGVKEDIRSFDASKINPESRQAVERLLQSRSESFDPKAAKRASVAAAPLASWVIANVKYSNVVDKIRPLEREQYKLQQNLQNAKDQIGQLSVGLSDVDAKVAELKVKLSTYTKEAAEIEINLKAAEDKLHSAEGLVSKLNEEYERWKTQLKELSEDLNQLSLKCILSAAYITYLSGEFENKRKTQIKEWCEILTEQDYNYNFEEFLSSDREQLQWQTEGLLADKLSIHNAIVILKSNINVLLLDPSSLALQWLRTHLKHRTIEIITPNAPRFTTSLELAVRFGKILIIEEIDEVPAVLYPILKKEFVYQGTRRLILLGNKLIDYHNDFCLYLSSRNIYVDIPSDALAVLSLVNFTTTNAGLTEQLLSAAIRQEYPDLESKRNELLQKREELQEQQYNLQNQLLEELANAKGDILQNKQLLTSLNDTKASSIAINSSLIDSTNIEIQLRTECDVLRPLSSFGSLLYFATTDLIRLNVMYTISISSFINLFLKSITTTNNAQEDYSQVQRTLLQSIYSYISRGMFKSDRLLFALYLCKHMFPQKITEQEWDLFVGHGKALPKTDGNDSNSHPNWIPDQFLHGLTNLQNTLPNVYNFLKLDDGVSWEKFMKQRACEQYFPSNLSEFQQVLIVQILRPDRLHSVMKKCALHLTGMKNLSPRSLYLTQLYKETVPNEPVLLVTAPGADPSAELRDLAAAFIGIDKYKEVAMGEGQESLALQCLEESAKLGHWLCLKNLHLVTSWSSLLSQKIQTLNPNENFRLWLVTEPHPLFSSVLIQSCTKLAYEAPPGIKNNLLRTYATWGKDYIQKQNATGARLLFVLAYVHALLQERRTYIPQGWTKWYEFSDVDLLTATKLSEEIWSSKTGSLLWNNIRGLCSDAVYGGRIDEQQDEKVLLAYLRENFLDSILSHKWKLVGMNTAFPNNSNYQDYVDCINQLSDNDTLSYFGLPANIDRALEKNSSTKIISNLKVISLPVKPSTKIEKEDWHRGLSHLLIFWKKLNKGQDWLRITVTKLLNGNTVLETYIAEEKCFTIELIQKIHSTLSTINKIARGTALTTEKDTEIANSLLAYQTPYEWQSYWKGPNEPFKYLQTIVDKATSISKWNSQNANDILLSSPVNLSSMFRPKMFFAALKQHTSRLTKIAIDDLHLINSWGKPLKSNVNVTLSGIFIEGAQFDGQKLSASSSDVESVTNAPICYISWVPKSEFDRNENYFEVPLYSSSRREEQLTRLLLPSEKSNHDQWLLAGISLFLEY